VLVWICSLFPRWKQHSPCRNRTDHTWGRESRRCSWRTAVDWASACYTANTIHSGYLMNSVFINVVARQWKQKQYRHCVFFYFLQKLHLQVTLIALDYYPWFLVLRLVTQCLLIINGLLQNSLQRTSWGYFNKHKQRSFCKRPSLTSQHYQSLYQKLQNMVQKC